MELIEGSETSAIRTQTPENYPKENILQGRPNLTWAEGIRGLMGEKGLMEEDWNDRGNWMKKKIIIIIFINCNWVVTRWQWLFDM